MMSLKSPKKMSWSTKDSVICGITAALTFATSFIFGAAITATLGPGMSGFVTIVITTMVVVFGAKLVNKLGALFMIGMIFSFLATPTSIFGPPGIQKLAIGVVIGVLYESTVWLFKKLKKENIGYMTAGATGSIGAIFAILYLLRILDQETASKLSAVIYWIWAPYGALGFIGGWFGIKLFQRLEHIGPIQNLKSSTL